MRKIVFFIGLILGFSIVQAQTLSLKDCRDLALKNNANLAASNYKIDQANHTERQYYANYLPNFKLIGGAWYNNFSKSANINLAEYPVVQALGTMFPDLMNLIQPIDLSFKTGLSYTAGLMLQQPIYMGGKITSAHNMAKLGQDVAKQQKALTIQEVLVQTDEAYVLAVKAKEMQKVAKQYNTMLQELLRQVESLKKHGMAAQNDLLRVQVKLNESELQLRKAENSIRLTKMNLCHAMGMNLTSDIDVKDEYPEEIEVDMKFSGIENRPEYIMLQKQVEVANEQIKLNRSDYLPNVALILDYGYTNAFRFNHSSVFDDFSFNGLVTVSVPLFHFGEGSHKVKAAKAQKAVVEMQQRDLNDKMELELAQAANNLDEAKLEVEVAQRSLSQADENLRITNNQYKNGMSTLTEVLEAQTLWQQAYESHTEAKFQAYLMQSKYLKAAGLLK
jgi:outer membrane protein TolC